MDEQPSETLEPQTSLEAAIVEADQQQPKMSAVKGISLKQYYDLYGAKHGPEHRVKVPIVEMQLPTYDAAAESDSVSLEEGECDEDGTGLDANDSDVCGAKYHGGANGLRLASERNGPSLHAAARLPESTAFNDDFNVALQAALDGIEESFLRSASLSALRDRDWVIPGAVDSVSRPPSLHPNSTSVDSESLSDTSLSDESSDSDSDGTDIRSTKPVRRDGEVTMLDDDDDESVPAGPLRTKNELADLPPVPEPPIVRVPQDQALVEVGYVKAVVGEQVIIQSLPLHGDNQALDMETVLALDDRSVIGQIFDTFGPVSKPLYSIRFNSHSDIDTQRIVKGAAVFRSTQFTHLVFSAMLLAMKGSDASNIHDEEIGEQDQEFSDDEAEQEWKRRAKQKRSVGKTTLTQPSELPNTNYANQPQRHSMHHPDLKTKSPSGLNQAVPRQSTQPRTLRNAYSHSNPNSPHYSHPSSPGSPGYGSGGVNSRGTVRGFEFGARRGPAQPGLLGDPPTSVANPPSPSPFPMAQMPFGMPFAMPMPMPMAMPGAVQPNPWAVPTDQSSMLWMQMQTFMGSLAAAAAAAAANQPNTAAPPPTAVQSPHQMMMLNAMTANAPDQGMTGLQDPRRNSAQAALRPFSTGSIAPPSMSNPVPPRDETQHPSYRHY